MPRTRIHSGLLPAAAEYRAGRALNRGGGADIPARAPPGLYFGRAQETVGAAVWPPPPSAARLFQRSLLGLLDPPSPHHSPSDQAGPARRAERPTTRGAGAACSTPENRGCCQAERPRADLRQRASILVRVLRVFFRAVAGPRLPARHRCATARSSRGRRATSRPPARGGRPPPRRGGASPGRPGGRRGAPAG